MKYFTFLLITFFLFVSCNKEYSNDDECLELETAYVTNVNAPSTGVINETIEIEVNFKVKNSCGNFNNFEEESIGNSKLINVIAIYDDCPCLQVIGAQTAAYFFSASVPGNYELKFRSGPDDFIIAVITIE